MPLGLAFWILMLLWLVGGLWQNWPNWQGWAVGTILQFLLFALLGWHVFGPMFHG